MRVTSVALIIAVAGCSSPPHYEVTVPLSGKYIVTEIDGTAPQRPIAWDFSRGYAEYTDERETIDGTDVYSHFHVEDDGVYYMEVLEAKSKMLPIDSITVRQGNLVIKADDHKYKLRPVK